jgi:5-methylcytosine-specific restriction endonuclease McrA
VRVKRPRSLQDRLLSGRTFAAVAVAVVAGIQGLGSGQVLARMAVVLVGAYVVLVVVERVWEGATWPDTPKFAKPGRQLTSSQLREDRNARFLSDRRGFLFRRRTFFIATGCPPIEVDADWHVEAQQRQKTQPVPVGRGDSRRYWWFGGEFFWENRNLSAGDLHALLRQRQRSAERKIEHARAMLEVERTGARIEEVGRARKPIPADMRRAVFARDGGRCVECESEEDLQFDHVIPHSMGGADSVENLQLLCAPCNLAKGARLG